MKKARVVLVGSGRMGRIRAPLLYANPRYEFLGIVDSNFEAASLLAEMFDVKAFHSLSKAIACYGTRPPSPYPSSDDDALTDVSSVSSTAQSSMGLDGIIISTPTFTHNALIREAALHGLHIFTEKPVDDTADLISDLFDFCKQNGARLCCGFQRRFDKSYVAIEQAIREKRIGTPLMATVFFGDHPAPPIEFMMQGGNIFMDLLPHDLDYVRWCLQDEVDSVYATGTSSTDELKNAGVHDNATAVVTFKRGAVVTFTMSRGASYGYDQRCDFFGNQGMARVENESSHAGVIFDVEGGHASKLKHSFPQRFEQAFKGELNAFADTILEHRSWPVTAQDCIAVQVVSDSARASCESGMPVKV